MWRGVAKSGSPISRWMTSRPSRSSCFACARTLNAVSVPRRSRLAASPGVAAMLTERAYRALRLFGPRRRVAAPEVADALEGLGTLAPPLPPRGLSDSSRNDALRRARTCYDHLAGRLGVAVAEALVERGHVLDADAGFAPTAEGV